MTVSAIFGGEQWVDFATTKGTGDFMRWADGLVADDFPGIVHLAEWGWTNDLPSLRDELVEAVKKLPPGESLRKTLDGFILAIESAPKGAASVMLSDGLTE